MRSVALLSLLVILGVASAIPTPHYKYDNRKVVSDDESPYFEIRWSLDSKNLRVAIVAETEDWVSLGFSADSSIEGSDGIIARIGEEGARVVDYFVPSDNSCPETICADKTLGCQDNIVVLRGQRIGGFIVVEYTRPVQGSDNCDQTISADKDHYVHWAVGAREVLGMNFQTQRFSFVPSLANLNKRSSTVEMIVLGGRELNMTIGRWFGHYTLQYWKNVDGSTVQLDADYNRQSFCTINPNAVQVAGTELVTMDGYSIYVPKTKRTIKGTTINWEVEDVQVSAGYCTTPTTDTVPCDQFNPAWPEAGTDFIPLVISTSSLADTWSAICQSNAEYEYVEQCTPSACYAVPVNFWTNSKYPDAAANTAAGFTALINQQTSVEGQTNSNTFIRVHVRQVFGREITDLTPGGREYPGNIYPVEVTDIWCGNEPWRTGIDPVPALKPCGTVKIATAPVTTSEVVTQDDFTQAVSEYINIEPEAIQVAGDSKGINGTLALTILDYRFRSGRGALDLLKLALDYNSTALQAYGIPGSVVVGDVTWEEVKVTEESGAISLGVSMILLTALLAFLAF